LEKRRKMKIAKSKTMAILIAALLTFSMTASMMLTPTASAHTPPLQIPTYAYVVAVPNPVGVGQQAHVLMWLNQLMDGAALTNNIRFHNYQLTITAPDGKNTTQTFSVVSDPTSNQGYFFTPTVTGKYTLTFNFPGQLYNFPAQMTPVGPNNAYIGDTYEGSSASTTLTVQQAPVGIYPPTPLPTQYWTRPIYGENSNWYTISSNWLGSPWGTNQGYGSEFPGDAIGPQTSHIMWTKPLQSGGVVGGTINTSILGDTYFEGSAYNNRYDNPIILEGMLYYTEPISFGGATSGPTVCVNLQTGQQIWSSNSIPALSFGYIYDVQDPNQHGVYPPILFAVTPPPFIGYMPLSTWEAFDANTGDPLFNVTNVPSGTSAIGPSGEYLILTLTNHGTPTQPSWYLAEWNSSRLWDNEWSGPSTSPSVVPPITNGRWTGGTVMTPMGPAYYPSLYDWNVSIPWLNTQTAAPSLLEAFTGNMVLGMVGTYPGPPSLFGPGSWSPYTYFAVNINATSGTVGTLLWHQTYQAPAGNLTVEWGGADPSVNVFVEQIKETNAFVGYSMTTGEKLWGPTPAEAALDYYNFGYNAGGNEEGTALAYGKLYSGGFSGIIYCYDLKTGNLLWTYGNGGEGNSTNSGLPYPGWYPTSIYAIGNGIIYTTTTEHTLETPIYKGALTRAINATTGQQIWTLSAVTGQSGPPGTGAIADGYATFFNGYDNSIYVVGRGSSATTVTASPSVTTYGDNVVIRGTVMDTSAGTQQSEQKADFPNGVPCASDASMSAWMSYVYQQQTEPTSFTGVPVTISVTDSNHNCYDIGTATTDASGMYTLTWTPIITGNYTVTATFAGTLGYWPSNAETSFNVMSAPPTAPPYPTPVTGLASTGSLELGIAAVIIVIVIIGIVLAILTVRKRP
jgi:hypothetical protein